MNKLSLEDDDKVPVSLGSSASQDRALSLKIPYAPYKLLAKQADIENIEKRLQILETEVANIKNVLQKILDK